MYSIILYIFGGLCIGLLIGLLLNRLCKMEVVAQYLLIAGNWCATNGLRVITGNDGCISHTRIINLVWCFGSLHIIRHCTYLQIPIQGEILAFMAAVSGFNVAQTVSNKFQEVKQNLGSQDVNTTQN